MKDFDIIGAAKTAEAELIALRRDLHRIPEYGDTLPLTRAYVCAYLDRIGVPYRIIEGGDGVVAEIAGARPGRTIGLRADMDALNGIEQTPHSYRSGIEGKMHGCGHDAHTAILLLTARILNERKENLTGNLRLLFQSGEETGTGARLMLASGALDGVDALFGLHVGDLAGDGLRAGELAILPGYVSAGKIKFTLTVKGKGTHSAFPERGVDPIPIAARIVNGCEELAAREIPAGTAAIISFGSLHAGEDHNTIPDTAVIRGSIRCQDDAVRAFLGERVRALAEGIAAAYRAECAVELKVGSPSVRNDEAMAALAAQAVASALGEEKVKTRLPRPLMASDDFANYAARIPSVYFMLHTNNEEKGIIAPNHSPFFDIDESVLWEGVAAYLSIARAFSHGDGSSAKFE